MQKSAHKNPWKTAFVIVACVFLTTALSTAAWFYRYSRLQEVPPPPARPLQTTRPITRIVADPQAVVAPGTGTPSESPSSAEQIPARPRFEISLDPMQEFQENLRKALHELVLAFPDLPNFLGVQTAKSADPAYRRVVFQLLDAAENAQADQRPAMLLAADLVAKEIWCPSENKEQCDLVRSEFAQHKLNLEHTRVGNDYVYDIEQAQGKWHGSGYSNVAYGKVRPPRNGR